jgi:hypothetical protein
MDRYREQEEAWRKVRRAGLVPDTVAGILHVGFASLLETEEELAALRREVSPAAVAKPARSGVTTTPETIRPIDRVAARVVAGADR